MAARARRARLRDAHAPARHATRTWPRWSPRRASTSLDAARLLESERRTRLRTEALQDVTSALSGAATPEEVGAAIAEHGARALAGTGGTVYVLDAGVLHVDRQLGLRRRARRPVPGDRARRAGAAGRGGARAPHGVRRRQTSPSATRRSRAAAARCARCRCDAGAEVLGAVGVSRASGHAVPAGRARPAGGAGRQGALALLRRSGCYDRLHRLQATTAALARALTPREVARDRGDAGRRGAHRVAARGSRCSRARSLELAHAAGHAPETRERFRSLPLDADLPLAQAARTRQPLWLERAAELFGRYPRFVEVRPQAQSAALLPLLGRGRGARRDRARVRPPARVRRRTTATTCWRWRGCAARRSAARSATRPSTTSPRRCSRRCCRSGCRLLDGVALAVRYVPGDRLHRGGRRLLRGARAARRAARDRDRRHRRPRPRRGRRDGPAAQRAARLRARGPLARARAAAAEPLRRRRHGRARGDGRLRRARSGRARGALRVRRAPAAAAARRRRQRPLPGGRARGAAGPLARLRLRGRDRGGGGREHADPLLRRHDRAPRRVARRRARAARAGGLGRRRRSLPTPSARGCWRRSSRTRACATTSRCWSCARARRSVAPLRLWFAARPDQLAVVRDAMRSWLAAAAVEPRRRRAGRAGRGRAVRQRGRARLPRRGRRGGRGRPRARARRDAQPAGARPRALAAAAARSRQSRPRALDRARADARRRHRRERRRDDGQRPLPPGLAAAPPRPRRRASRRGSTFEYVDEVAVAHVTGEVDSANAADVGRALLALAPGPLVVNLSSTGFLGSAGLRVLFALAAARDGVAVVAPRHASFRRALEVSELGRVVVLALSFPEALEKLR